MTQRVLVAFQGGGARGIAHIGALQALEEWTLAEGSVDEDPLRPEIAGVAGTSAGAIIAALVAARYSANEIFDPGKRQHLLERVAEGRYQQPKRLFTRRGWWRIAFVRLIAAMVGKRIFWFKWIGGLAVLGLVAWWVAPIVGLPWQAKALSVVVALSIALTVVRYARGLAPLTAVRAVVDEALLAASLPGDIAGKDVTFLKLAEAGGLPLKIIATNVTTKTIQVFSAQHTPDIAVADAVCASICLPFVFPPYKISVMAGQVSTQHRFVDGGVLSNLPLWSFDEERTLDPDLWTIGFSLNTGEARTHVSKKSSWLSGMIDAVVSGPSEIHARAMPGLMVVPIPTSLRLLDFDVSFDTFSNDIALAKKSCSEAMIAGASEPFVLGLLERLQATFVAQFQHFQSSSDAPSDSPLVLDEHSFKLAIALPRATTPSVLWPRFRIGYETEAVERGKPIRRAEAVEGEWDDPTVVVGWDNDDEISMDGENWLVQGSRWLVGIKLISGQDASPAGLAPILMIESSTLTIAQLATTLGSEAAFGLKALVPVISKVVGAFDDQEHLGHAAMRAQLWK